MSEASHLLTVAEVRRETPDAVSVVFDVPDSLVDEFAFRAGQFLTLAVPVAPHAPVARSYSVCVPPGEPLTVTVKRTEDGYASRWINDQLRPGQQLRTLLPSGTFTPRDLDADLLLFAAGSGITPVMSILRTALRDGSGRVVLRYANRDRESVIFAEALDRLAGEHPDRLDVDHWLESERGLPVAEDVREVAAAHASYDAFVCGPEPFLALAVAALRELGFPRARRHQERFLSLDTDPFGDAALRQ